MTNGKLRAEGIPKLDDSIRDVPINVMKRMTWVENQRSFRWFTWVVGFSFMVRLAALWLARNAPLASDAQDYSNMARQLLSGQPFIPYWPPGSPLFLAPFVAAGANDLILRATSLIFWLLACWGLYRLMKALGVAGAAWLVLLLFSLLPDAIQMSIEPMTQMPVAALLVVALSSSIRIIRGASPSEYLLLGGTLGVMSLVRPSALPLVIVLPLACGMVARKIYPMMTGMALGIVIIFCWVFHAHTMTGRWIIDTANATNIYYGNNPWTPMYRTWFFGSHAKPGSVEIEQFPEYEQTMQRVNSLPVLDRPAEFERLAVASIREHPGSFIYRTASRIRCFFGFDVFTSAALSAQRQHGPLLVRLVLVWEALIYLLIAVPAVFWIFQASGVFWRSAENLILLGVSILYAAPYWISMSHPTYHFPLLLPIAILGVCGWRMSETGGRIRLRAYVAVLALLLIQVEWVWQMSRSLTSHG